MMPCCLWRISATSEADSLQLFRVTAPLVPWSVHRAKYGAKPLHVLKWARCTLGNMYVIYAWRDQLRGALPQRQDQECIALAVLSTEAKVLAAYHSAE